ncbi:MAG: nucleotidyltransferase family protein [Tranquillimonas sp.]
MRNRPDAVMLFAAGFGTRMGALTRDRPKPLVEVAGRPLIDHALSLARDAGVSRIVANLHYRAEMLERHLAPQGIALSVEQPRILETGGGLRQALPLLGDGPVFTANTDAVWTGPNPYAGLRAAWDPARMDALLLLIPAARAAGHAGRGDFARDEAGRLTRGGGLTYTGIQILRTDRLRLIPDTVFSLNRLWDAMAAEGRLHGTIHPGGWCDVGQPASIPLAEALLAGAGDV